MKVLNIGQEFSQDPSGRYIDPDGEASGEAFREKYLRKHVFSLAHGEKLEIILDGDVESYGSSFLVEGFAGLVKYGYIKGDELLDKLILTHSDPDFEFYKNKIIQYIKEAKFASKVYKDS
jgi:hypothetical protein